MKIRFNEDRALGQAIGGFLIAFSYVGGVAFLKFLKETSETLFYIALFSLIILFFVLIVRERR